MGEGRVIFITHSALAEPGAVAAALHARGYMTEICCPFLGDSLPRLQGGRPVGFAAAIVLGGPMVVSDAAEKDFIAAEIAWVASLLASGAPLLGICLGAQMMAHALGAKVWEHPDGVREIGYHRVDPAPAGGALFPGPLIAYQWHREGFDLPAGAELLATGGAAFYHQAFRHGDNSYAIQFHPEMIPPTMERWITSETGAPQLHLPGAQSAQRQRAEAPRHNPAMRRWLDNFIKVWLG
jgi:GMP synthase (glutamine-hydrolysing)